MIICKFCNYKPSLPIKRMLVWKSDYCCEDCFKAKLLESDKKAQPQAYKPAVEVSGEKI